MTAPGARARLSALAMHPGIERAAYVGRFGWVTIAVTSARTLKLALAFIRESYELVAKKRP